MLHLHGAGLAGRAIRTGAAKREPAREGGQGLLLPACEPQHRRRPPAASEGRVPASVASAPHMGAQGQPLRLPHASCTDVGGAVHARQWRHPQRSEAGTWPMASESPGLQLARFPTTARRPRGPFASPPQPPPAGKRPARSPRQLQDLRLWPRASLRARRSGESDPEDTARGAPQLLASRAPLPQLQNPHCALSSRR